MSEFLYNFTNTGHYAKSTMSTVILFNFYKKMFTDNSDLFGSLLVHKNLSESFPTYLFENN